MSVPARTKMFLPERSVSYFFSGLAESTSIKTSFPERTVSAVSTVFALDTTTAATTLFFSFSAFLSFVALMSPCCKIIKGRNMTAEANPTPRISPSCILQGVPPSICPTFKS